MFPNLSPGVERLGLFAGPKGSEPKFLLRRVDGTMLLVSELLYSLAGQIDGRTAVSDIAKALSKELDRSIDADGVSYLIDHKLAPLGLIARTGPETDPSRPLLGIAGRTVLLSGKRVRPVARVLQHLFHAPVVGLVLAVALALHLWLIRLPGSPLNTDKLFDRPGNLLIILAITVMGGLFHELGHGSASLYAGAQPGPIGVGFYIIWPAFYTDITESYRLNRAGRIRTDLGGIYFNLLLTVMLGGLYALTDNPVWAWSVLAQDLIIAQQFIPFLRLDGYYLMSDLTGIPNLFDQIRPVLAGLAPGRRSNRPLSDLRPRVKIAVTIWVISTALFLGGFFLFLALRSPYILQNSWLLTASGWHSTTGSLASGKVTAALGDMLQLVLVLVQTLGLVFILSRVGLSGLRMAWRWAHPRFLSARYPALWPPGMPLNAIESDRSSG